MLQIARMSPLLVLLAVAAAGPELAAQTYPYDVDTRPKTGFLPDSMVGGVDSIGPANGGLHLNIPIASLPAGAAGMGFELSLVYNSANYAIQAGVWETPRYGNPTASDLEQYPKYYQTLYTEPGWRYNFQNYRIEEETRDLDRKCGDSDPDFPLYPRVYRTRVGLGDGSLHALHLYGDGPEAGAAVEPEGFYHFSYTGWPHSKWPACLNTSPVDDMFDVRRTLYSSDGSYVKLEMGPDPDQEWILSMPDGRQVRGTDLLANKLYDANGNWVEIDNLCRDLNCDQPYAEIRDPYYAADSNRRIRIEWERQTEGPSRHTITAPTATGMATWTVDFDVIDVPGGAKTYEKTPDDDPLNNEDGDQPLRDKKHFVVKKITYPVTPATAYAFEYNDGAAGWGELNKVTAPSGAVIVYTYENDSHRDSGALMENPVLTRTVTHGEAPDVTTDTWSYAYPNAAFITTNPDGGVVTKTFETSDRERISKIVGPDGLVVERTWAHNSVQSIVGYLPPVNNPYVAQERRTETNTAGAGSKTAITDFSYNGNGLLTSRIEYEWANYEATADTKPLKVVARDTTLLTVDRRIDLWYHYPHPSPSPTLDFTTGYWREHNRDWIDPAVTIDPTLPRRLDAVRRRTISNSMGPKAVTEYEYDNEYTTGNVKYEKRWDSLESTTVPGLGTLSAANAQVLTRGYDSRGNVTEIGAPGIIDAPEIHTTIDYDSLPGVDGPGPYPNRVVYAPGTILARTWSYDWDDASGWLNSGTDVDNALTTDYTYDALGRPLTVTEAGERKTAFDYDDRNRRVTTSSDLLTLGDGKLQTIAQYDMLGRVVETRVSDGDALSTSNGIVTTTDYIHTAGAPLKVVTSAPYRPPADATLERTCTQFDRRGRPTAIGVFRGAAAPADCEMASATRTGLTRIAYIANQTTITDPAGKTRVEFRDALGRLTQVTEDPGADPKLNYVTTYNYDPLDNLLKVSQFGHYVTPTGDPPVQPQPTQSRSFDYSSLSRLTSATNPESGTTRYTYHDAGNLATRTDARGVLAKYGYDALQRLKTIEYTIPPDPTPETPNDWPAPTPDVTYRYHMSGSPNIGQLESIFSDAAKAIYNSYDALGRVKSMSQTIAGHPDTFTFANTYYLNDALDTQTYPSGRSVEYTLDDAGRVKTVSDGTTTSDDATTYADMSVTAGHAYAPDGRLRQMLLGNGLWETRDYDRLETPQGQPRRLTTRYKLVTPDETTMLPGATERVALGYHYSGTANNGNPMSHTIARSGTTWTQTFGYDGVNRLKTATETNGYNREFGYDAFGNRWVASNTHTTPSIVVQESHEPRFQSQFDPATNRMTTSQTVDYDAAGNQTRYSPHTLVYDAENRLTSMTSASSGSGTYLYDGQGRRVKKTWTPGGGTAEDTYYVYDIAGRLAAEYGTASNPTPATPATLYPFTDMLGSVRAVTDAAGTVVECYDYLPFGRMLNSSDNGRPASCHPSPSDTALDSEVSQKFTGQVRDEETRLDYFKARYMSAPQGRFLSADLPFVDQHPGDPQSWNLFAYVRNNPLRFVDRWGYCLVGAGTDYTIDYSYGPECSQLPGAQFSETLNAEHDVGLAQAYAEIAIIRLFEEGICTLEECLDMAEGLEAVPLYSLDIFERIQQLGLGRINMRDLETGQDPEGKLYIRGFFLDPKLAFDVLNGPAFRKGLFSPTHREIGRGRSDYRQIAPQGGSLQVVINRTTLYFYADIDVFDAYDPIGFFGHGIGEFLIPHIRRLFGR